MFAGAEHSHIFGQLSPSAELSLITAFVFGVLGSTHCFGMCGPLVSLYSRHLPHASFRTAQRQHLLYNLGRVIVYTDLGLLLLSFSLGTVPMMWGIGLVAARLSQGRRVMVQRVFGGLVLLWGTVLVWHGIGQIG